MARCDWHDSDFIFPFYPYGGEQIIRVDIGPKIRISKVLGFSSTICFIPLIIVLPFSGAPRLYRSFDKVEHEMDIENNVYNTKNG